MKAHNHWSSVDNLLAEGKKYNSRSEFRKKNNWAYKIASKMGVLDLLYPTKFRTLTDEELITLGRTFKNRIKFLRDDCAAYQSAARRGLLDIIHPPSYKDWSDDAVVLAEAAKHSSRVAFRNASGAAYHAARKRNLLDQINWAEENAPSDNNAIYIWRAVGQHYNGNPVYKIGVTSVRLGTARIEEVARKSGFEFDLICCEPVQCKATELERKLHLLGEDPQLTGFNGATEFRALSDSALYAAVSMICNQL